MSLTSLAEGSVFAGRYRIVRCIAQGGMGAVYEVVHTETQRRRALKVMLPNMLQNQDMRDRFRQEACVTANIESDYIVDVLDAGIDEKTQMPFLVMELLRGEELDKRLRRLGRLDAREVVTYLHHVALALDKTHRASIVHRDLKPGNVFLTEREDGTFRAKILDFGVAKLIAEGATSAGATQSLGTPLYMAPEQFNIGQKVSPAADIYALGMMAYTLLVGVPYWQEEASAGANIFAFAAKAMHGPPEPATVRAIRQGVQLPASIDAWFAKATATSLQARFATASAAIAALAEALDIPLGLERASSMPAAPLMAPRAVDRRASSPSLSPSTPGVLGAVTPGPVRISDSGTIPLLHPPVTAELPARTSALPLADHTPSPPALPSAMPAHVTAGGMATTAGPKGSRRTSKSLVIAAGALSVVLIGGLVFFVRGEAASGPEQGSEETRVDKPAPEAARPSPSSTPPESSAAPMEAAQQPSSLPAPAISQEPASAPATAGSTSPLASPSAAPSVTPSARPSVASGQAPKPPSSGAAPKPTATSTKSGLKRD
jgi:serine/threonine-protein kinase